MAIDPIPFSIGPFVFAQGSDYMGAAANAGAHNSVYRGANLGTNVTDEQYAAIQDGTFYNMFIGDYWVINGRKYLIAAFDYYFGTGNTPVTQHHVVLVPAGNLSVWKMNTSLTTNGGYVGSDMYTNGLAQAREFITNDFGAAHILSHQNFFINTVTDGVPSAGAWVSSTIDLMSEINVYGSRIYSSASNGTVLPTLDTIDTTQFPLFAFDQTALTGSTFWLRDVVDIQRFAGAYSSGLASRYQANTERGVRPCFCICA